MPRSLFLSSFKAALLCLAVALIIVPAAIHSARALTSSLQQTKTKGRPVPGPPLRAEEVLETLAITLKPGGFEPNEVTTTAGKTLFTLHKRVGVRDIAFELRVGEQGEVVQRMQMSEKTLSWSEIIELHPGHYTLSVVDSPDWVCRIQVRPRKDD